MHHLCQQHGLWQRLLHHLKKWKSPKCAAAGYPFQPLRKSSLAGTNVIYKELRYHGLHWSSDKFIKERLVYCQRFELEVHTTRHARERMAQRNITESELSKLLETGEAKYKDEARLWLAGLFPARSDNLICVAAVLEDKVVVKTVMHHFSWEGAK